MSSFIEHFVSTWFQQKNETKNRNTLMGFKYCFDVRCNIAFKINLTNINFVRKYIYRAWDVAIFMSREISLKRDLCGKQLTSSLRKMS